MFVHFFIIVNIELQIIPDDNVFFELSIKVMKSRTLSQNGVYFLQILLCKVTCIQFLA